MNKKLKAHEVLAVGIDPAKDKHSVVALRYPDDVLFAADIPNSPEAIKKLDAQMLDLSKKEGLSLIYATEDSTQYGAVLAKILSLNKRILRPINPAKSSRQKHFYGDNKNDKVDARSVASVALRELDKLHEVREFPQKGENLETLSSAVDFRNDLVRMSVTLQNRLHEALYELWGYEYKNFFANIDGKAALEFWKKYPSAAKAKKDKVESISILIFEKSEHRITKELSREKSDTIMKTAKSYADLFGSKSLEFTERNVIRIVESLENIKKQLGELEDEINEILPKEAKQLKTLDGIGTVTSAEMVCIIGDIKRFENRNKFAKYNGTAPREWSSGKSKKHYPSRHFNRKLKRLIMNAALVSARCNSISKSYFERKISQGKTKSQAYKCLARRISDIIYSMLKNGMIYDHDRHNNKINGRIRVDSLDSTV